MKDLEYRKLGELEHKEFHQINHNRNLEFRMKKFDKLYNFLRQDKETIRDYQIKRLSELVDYAYTNISLYRKKYDEINYKIGSIKTFEDFYKLPLLYKDELINGFPNEIVKDTKDFRFSTRSSGSSGKFLTIAVDLEAIYTDTMQGIRQFINQSNGKYNKENTVLFIYTCPWWIKHINGKYKLDYLPTTTEPKDAIEYIKKSRPFIISTYPTYLQRFCDFDIKLSDYGVEYVIVHSEQSSKDLREAMAKKLGVVVLDEYSSEELTRIALECNCGHYHIEEDACYVEILDKTTFNHITQGPGVVVGTNLLNMATPIIRYYQGDVVTIDEAMTCNCGNNGRIISQVNGREMDCIYSENSIIAASSFMDLAYNWFLKYKIPVQGIKYQIVQTEKNQIKIYLSKGLYTLSKEDLEKIKNSMYSLVSHQINIIIEFTENFIYKSNKFKPVINLIGDNK